MSNIEKLINLQRRFEKDARYFADKEDYTSFEKVIEDFIIEAGKLNPDINTRDLLSRHLSKAGKVRSYSDALQVMNSISSDITILSMDLHGKGEPIYTASEYDKLRRDNGIEYTKNSFEVFKKSFDLLKKNNSDRFSKIDDLRNLYLGNVKNYKDKVFKFPHLVDTEQRKLFDTLKNNITKQVFDTFEKDREILLSYLSEIAEIGKAYVDRNVDFSDRLLDGYNIQKRREAIRESVDIEKLRRDLDMSNEKNIDDLLGSIKKCFDSYIKGVENLMIEHSKLYNNRIERTRAERVILGGQDEVKGIIERYKKQLEDIITSGLSEDEEIFYSIMDELKNNTNENNMNRRVNENNDQVAKELERIINQSIDDAYEYSANVYSSIIYHLDDLQKDRVNLDDYDTAGLVEDKFYEYAGEYDIAYSKHIKKYADKVVVILGKAGVNQGQVKQIIDKYDSMFPGGVDGIGKYFDSKISPLIKDFDRHGSLDKLIKSLEREEEIFSNEVSASLHRLGDELKNFVSEELNENGTTIIKPINESRVNKGRRYYQKSLYLNESGALASKLGKKVKSLGQDICDEDNNPYYDDIFMAYYTIADKGVEYLKKGKAKDFHRDFEKLIDKANADIQLLYIKSINAYNSEVYDAITEYVDMYNEIAGRGDDNDDLLRDEESDTKKEIDRVVEDTIGKVIFELKSIKSISSRDIKKSYTDDVTFKNEDEEEDIKLWSGNMTDDLVTYIINLHQTSLVPKIQNLVSKLGSLSESRRDTFFEAEEDKKPKISKEEKEKLKAQLDNFFADKKEAKATELKKSIADRDKAIEDVILKYSTEKEKIQREYSKNIQAAKSEAEANKLRAERDEELQRLSLEKATSIEDLKERQKKEEASIREKYQTLFDKKLEEYKDSLGDAIGDFAKDIERGIEDGIRKNPIFQ